MTVAVVIAGKLLRQAKKCLKGVESFAKVSFANYKNKAVLLQAEIESV